MKLLVVFGRAGAGKSTIAQAAVRRAGSEQSSWLAIDLDVCVPDWMRQNFGQGIYPDTEQRAQFAQEACQHVREQQAAHPASPVCLVSFSFVNSDLREHFRADFPDAVWILVDTLPGQAAERIASRQGHFYTGPPEGQAADEWEFAPVEFGCIRLDGAAAVAENAARVCQAAGVKHTFHCGEGLRGHTATSERAPLPASEAIFIHVQRDKLAEFRLCLLPNGISETRGAAKEQVLCFAIGQHDNRIAAMGLGNPHLISAEDGYRHCELPRAGDVKNFWIFCDRSSGWIALGHGKVPDIGTTLLTCRLRAELQPSLAALTCAVVSNWEDSVSVVMRAQAMQAADLQMLHMPSDKFDLAGAAIGMRGLTFVCDLPASECSVLRPISAIMYQVRHALATDPALASNFALLPLDSFHMTVLDLISGLQYQQAVEAHLRDPAASTAARAQVYRMQFPDGLTEPEQLYITAIAQRLEQAGIMQSVPWTTFAMRAVGLDDLCKTVELEPWDDSVCDALEAWRKAVAESTNALGTNRAGPIVRRVPVANGSSGRRWARGAYRFHMTVAYENFPIAKSKEAWQALARIRQMSAAAFRDLGPVLLKAPHFRHFASMERFDPVTLL